MFSSFNKGLAKVVDYLLIIVSFGLIILITFQILNRFIFHVSAAWTEEMCRYVFVWIALIGSAKATRERQHIAVDIIAALNEGKTITRVLNVIAKVSCLFLFTVFVISGIVWCKSTAGTRATTMTLPLIYIYIVVPFSFICMFLFELENLINDIKEWITVSHNKKVIIAEGGKM